MKQEIFFMCVITNGSLFVRYYTSNKRVNGGMDNHADLNGVS
ncbi:hypothetical protein MNBD_GAMMA21-1702 [hydrothermal vent metagenome]|uniref:Uncharacterized protein n=1 Tax=hydrothermal vent metagenome TaxID=652676 RepID=A0A3B0ZVG7_9ZZZZ